MSRFREEISVIPRLGWVASVVAAVGFASLIVFIAATEGAPPVVFLAAAIFAATVLLIYGLLVAYVYGDSKRRGMRPLLWTLIAVFVPNAIGIIAYFILREPLLQPCPSCGTTVRREFAYCSSCGMQLARACPSCDRKVEPIWSHCAHCGGKLPAAAIEPSPAEKPPAPAENA